MLQRLTLSLLLVLLLAPSVRAQGIPVFDAANLAENAISAIQSVLTTIQTILIEANQILELTPVDDVAVAGGIIEDMQILGAMVDEAQGLSYDWGSLQAQITALFHLDTAPDTRDGLTQRLAEIKRLKYDALTYEARLQTLLKTASHTIDHLIALLELTGALIGNMQGNQLQAQLHLVKAKHAAQTDVLFAAHTRRQTIDALGDNLVYESTQKIMLRRMEGWPTW
jgi:conjugal transfer/entry exclusion protein